MKTIIFKSTPENWKKEYLGLKRNTVREFEMGINDTKEDVLLEHIMGKCSLINVEITNTETFESFTRSVTDVSVFGKGTYIISW